MRIVSGGAMPSFKDGAYNPGPVWGPGDEAKPYNTVRCGWASHIKCEEGEVIFCLASGDESTLAVYAVGAAETLLEEYLAYWVSSRPYEEPGKSGWGRKMARHLYGGATEALRLVEEAEAERRRRWFARLEKGRAGYCVVGKSKDGSSSYDGGNFPSAEQALMKAYQLAAEKSWYGQNVWVSGPEGDLIATY